jgi:hypothetical protein
MGDTPGEGTAMIEAILLSLKDLDERRAVTPSADVCSACGAKEGEPCRGNCERRMPSHEQPIDIEERIRWHKSEARRLTLESIRNSPESGSKA